MNETTKNEIAQVVAIAIQSDISQHLAAQQAEIVIQEDNGFEIHLTSFGGDDVQALDTILRGYGRYLSGWSVNPSGDPQKVSLLIFTERHD